MKQATMTAEGGEEQPWMAAGSGNGKGKPNEELVITEKPKVSWDEVVGLDTAKKAVKEAIVYPVQRPDLVPVRVATWHTAVWSTWLRQNFAGGSGCNRN